MCCGKYFTYMARSSYILYIYNIAIEKLFMFVFAINHGEPYIFIFIKFLKHKKYLQRNSMTARSAYRINC